MAFALAGRQPRVALRGIGVALLGLLAATILAMLTTWLLNVIDLLPPHVDLLEKPLLEERVRPGWYSVSVALAAGIAGTLALAEEKIDTAAALTVSVPVRGCEDAQGRSPVWLEEIAPWFAGFCTGCYLPGRSD